MHLSIFRRMHFGVDTTPITKISRRTRHRATHNHHHIIIITSDSISELQQQYLWEGEWAQATGI